MFKLTILPDTVQKKVKSVQRLRRLNAPTKAATPIMAVPFYRELVKDEYGEVLIPDETGGLLRVIDVCLHIAEGKSVHEVCKGFGVHPIRFMMIRDRFPEVDSAVRAAMELAGEEDIARATRLVEAMDNANMPVNKEKMMFFVWRGKNRYRRMYGDVKGSGVNIDMSKSTTVNSFELNASIRKLEKQPTKALTLAESDYTCD